MASALGGLLLLSLSACAQPWTDADSRAGGWVTGSDRDSDRASDRTAWVAQLATAQGGVWLYDREQGEWLNAQRDGLRNWPVGAGDRLRTDPGARSTLRVGALTLRLDGDSDLELLRLDGEQLGFRLWRGHLAVQVLDDAQARRTVLVGALAGTDVQAIPQRSGHYRLAVDGQRAVATTWRGELRVAPMGGADDPMLVTAGRELALWRDAGSGAWRNARRASQPDDFADWALAEGRLDQAPQSAQYVSTEASGWQALDSHGQWRDDPQWGKLWVPRDVQPGWAPYRDGRWAWVAPWGWTWIDTAPWGFATYHYGQWVAWRGGWGWVPAPRHQRPVFRTVQPGWTSPPPPAARGDRLAYPVPPRLHERPPHERSPGPVADRNVPDKTVPTNPWPRTGSAGRGPAAPTTTHTPMAPVAPVAPVAPATPVTPVTPVTPITPVQPRSPQPAEQPNMPTPRVPGQPRRGFEPVAPTTAPAPAQVGPVVPTVAPVTAPPVASPQRPEIGRPERPDRQDSPLRPRQEPAAPDSARPTPVLRPAEPPKPAAMPAEPAREQPQNKGERTDQPTKSWR